MFSNALYASISKQFYFLILFISITAAAQNKIRDLSGESWRFSKASENNWHIAKVPGTVHTDLLANHLIPDPFFGANEKQLQWIENEDWAYTTTFSVSKAELSHENCVLQFDGLDTYAEIFLNGKKILDADNMFRTWKVPVKNQLRPGSNTLKILFASAVKRGKSAAKTLPHILPGDEKVFTRKAQYHYGWDWGPRFATAGIWKKPSLHFWDKAVFGNIYCEQLSLDAKTAKLLFHINIEAQKAGNYTIQLSRRPFEKKLKKGSNKVTIPLEITNPVLWWPNGLGVAHQYFTDFSLLYKTTALDKKRVKTGLRTIELVQEKDTAGKSFYFKVNGVPVFMKGANYIPPDSFLPRANDSVYKNIVKNAADANMNMLRVWGGGVYPDDVFYDECDKKGILVWQDFMFACAMYPGDAAFLENVRNEVIDNVTRLQNHPSLALWCGNNESDEGWNNWGWQKQYNYTPQQEAAIWNDYKKLFHELIPQTLGQLLPENENRYWPSSPSIGWGRKESLLEGDSHYWGVWWGMEPFTAYEKKVGRFMSEYGFQGMPDMAAFRSFANEDELHLGSEAVMNHQKHPTGYQTINTYMARDYNIPKSFEDYGYVSQLLQAAGMKTAIEAHRRAKPYCMGSLYWQLNDCWPVTSWSSVDYTGQWKAFHYQAKRSFENLLVSVKEEDGKTMAYIINDGLGNYRGTLSALLMDFSGKVLSEQSQTVDIPGNSGAPYLQIGKETLKGIKLNEVVLQVSFTSGDKIVKANHYFLKPKDLALPKPNITITPIDSLTITITSDVLAKDVFLSDGGTHFSDNFFDLLPNRKVQVKLSKPANSIAVKSLFDTVER